MMNHLLSNLEKIKSGLFLDDLKFGCSKEEFLKTVGEPDEEQILNEGTEDEFIEFNYADNIYVSFDKSENYRFTIIEFYGIVLQIDGVEFKEGKYNDIKERLTSAGWEFSTPEKQEDSDYFIDIDSKGIMIFFDEDDDCVSISISPSVGLDDNGEEFLNWPE